jgi:hypothetical protein
VRKGDVLRHREKTMSTMITTAFVAAVIAFASPAPTVGNGNRNNEHMFKSAQYCVPDYDMPGAPNTIYCRWHGV